MVILILIVGTVGTLFQLPLYCIFSPRYLINIFSAAAGGVNHKGQPTGRNVYLRYYPPVAQKDMGKKKRDDLPVFEQAENVDNPLRCPVKLYEFYLSKCPESIKNRTDVFYLVPERYFICNSFICHSFYYGFIYSLIHSSF